MKPTWRRFAPLGLYLALLAALASAGLYIVQRTWNLPLQISLGLFVIGLALYAALDPEQVRVFLTGRQARYGSNALVLSLAVIGILVVVNYLVYTNSKRWDLTENQQFTLAPETIDTLAKLPQPVHARAFFTPAANADTALGLLDQYKFKSEGNFDYEFINPEAKPLEAQEAGITRDATVVLSSGERKELITLISEQELTTGLIRLMSEGERKVYFLTGHGERGPENTGETSYSQASSSLESKNYIVETLNLLSTHTIPDDTAAIVVAGPTKPVTQEEVDLLKGYLETGGALIVMEEPPYLTELGEEPDPLVDFLSASWGIRLGNDMVVDLASNQYFLAVSNNYNQHVITEKLTGMGSLYPTARSVIAGEAASGAILVSLVETSEQSWAESSVEELKAFEASGELPAPTEGVDQLGPVPLVVVGEDQLAGARVAVFGDVDFGSDSWFGQYGNGDMLINSIDWATEQENLINLTPKENIQRLVVPPGRYALNLILLGSVFILPGLVLVAGVVVWIQRRRRG
ncbi:MAG TPA: GldG family protein [Anaerolineales bacterium]|nr:GldG family protein [Anaerolineales bacterium]